MGKTRIYIIIGIPTSVFHVVSYLLTWFCQLNWLFLNNRLLDSQTFDVFANTSYVIAYTSYII